MSDQRTQRGALLALACAALLLVSCREGGPSDARARTSLTVFAASSLTDAFLDLEEAFEAAYPEIDVQPAFAGSQVLRLQLEQGAEADLFASANEQHMEALRAAGIIAESEIFAENELVVITPADNPAGLRTFADLERAERLVLGARNVPIGIYAEDVLARAEAQLGAPFVSRVRANVVSEESNVRLVRAKVELGEADAAIVYRTDALAGKGLATIDIPPALNVRARCPLGRLSRAAHPDAAQAFMAFMRAEVGRAVLDRHGFLVEPAGAKSATSRSAP